MRDQDFDVCTCGHQRRYHEPQECGACLCTEFTHAENTLSREQCRKDAEFYGGIALSALFKARMWQNDSAMDWQGYYRDAVKYARLSAHAARLYLQEAE